VLLFVVVCCCLLLLLLLLLQLLFVVVVVVVLLFVVVVVVVIVLLFVVVIVVFFCFLLLFYLLLLLCLSFVFSINIPNCSRINCTAENITPTGFNIRLSTWSGLHHFCFILFFVVLLCLFGCFILFDVH